MVCVYVSVGEGFSGFQEKASRFPASESISVIGCLVFGSVGFLRLVA